MKTIITGYPFRQAIMDVDKKKTLKAMGVRPKGKIISFFDEMSFDEISRTKITEEHCISFWSVILSTAIKFPAHTVIVKPKDINRIKDMSEPWLKCFEDGYAHLAKCTNAYILDETKWSFIEAIGVSDIVVTQGMFSSATIGLICGKEGLFFDESGYSHPLKDRFKDLLVFDNKGRLFDMIGDIVDGFSPIKLVTKKTLRQYNKYDDGMDRMRKVICEHI